MLTLRPSTVPLYLHSSKLYQSLDANVDAEFAVPSTAFKADLSIKSTSDLSLLFRTLAFWMSTECFEEVIYYIYKRLSKSNLRIICEKHGQVSELQYVKLLRHIRVNPSENPLNLALSYGNLKIVAFMRMTGFVTDEDSLVSAVSSGCMACIRFVIHEKQASALCLSAEVSLQSLVSYYTVFMNRTVCIRPSDVPSYLHNSELYNTLDLDNNDEFEVPILNYKLDSSVISFADLVLLFDTLNYWGSCEIFSDAVHYIYKEYQRIDRYQRIERHLIYKHFAWRWKYVDTMCSIVTQMNHGDQMDMALEFGVLELVVFLREQGLQLGDLSMRYAIRSQNPDMIRFVNENRQYLRAAPSVNDIEYYCKRRRSFVRAQACDIAVLKHCISQQLTDIILNAKSSVLAAKAGDLELLQKLRELRCPWDVTCCTEMAEQGHLHCLKYAHEIGAPWDASTCAAAANNRHIKCLIYLIENRCPADCAVSRAAIANGDIEMLIFAHENLLPWEDDMCMLAALAGSLPCLKYLHEAGCELTSETCSAAASKSIECLKYSHENGAPWTVSTTIAAAKSGNLSRLEYAHQNGCPVDKQVCMAAIAAHCSYQMLRYMGENRFPLDSNLYRQAIKQGAVILLQLLHVYGCPWTEATTRDAAKRGCLKSLRYAAERGCPVPQMTCSFGAYSGETGSHFMCVKYIFDNHDSNFDSICAITRDHFACFCYAHNNGAPWREEIAVTAARLGKLNFLRFIFKVGNCPFYRNFAKSYMATKCSEDKGCITYMEELRNENIRKLQRSLRRMKWLRRPRLRGWMVVRKVLTRGLCASSLQAKVNIMQSRFEILHSDIAQTRAACHKRRLWRTALKTLML